MERAGLHPRGQCFCAARPLCYDMHGVQNWGIVAPRRYMGQGVWCFFWIRSVGAVFYSRVCLQMSAEPLQFFALTLSLGRGGRMISSPWCSLLNNLLRASTVPGLPGERCLDTTRPAPPLCSDVSILMCSVGALVGPACFDLVLMW
jgi:hypothetical protein